MRIRTSNIRASCLVLAVAFTYLHAQEVKYVDLTDASQRTNLRFPAASVDCTPGGGCRGGGSGALLIADGAPNSRDPHALGLYVEHVGRNDINPRLPIELEFKLLNTGLAPIEVPVSPHLSELQPADDAADFDYLSITLGITLMNADPQGPEVHSSADVELYGSVDHAGTVLTIKPGEWIRIKAKVKLHQWPKQPVSVRIGGHFLLRKNTYHPHPGGSDTKVLYLYPNRTPTPWTDPVNVLPLGESSDQSDPPNRK